MHSVDTSTQVREHFTLYSDQVRLSVWHWLDHPPFKPLSWILNVYSGHVVQILLGYFHSPLPSAEDFRLIKRFICFYFQHENKIWASRLHVTHISQTVTLLISSFTSDKEVFFPLSSIYYLLSLLNVPVSPLFLSCKNKLMDFYHKKNPRNKYPIYILIAIEVGDRKAL